jgi:hypothetical protein
MTQSNVTLYYYVKVYIFKSHKYIIELNFEDFQGVH